MKRPRVIWYNRINGYGVTFKHPIKLTWNEDLGGFWDKEGNESFDWYEKGDKKGPTKLGYNTEMHEGIRTFTSANRKEAETWTEGAQAVVDQLRFFAS